MKFATETRLFRNRRSSSRAPRTVIGISSPSTWLLGAVGLFSIFAIQGCTDQKPNKKAKEQQSELPPHVHSQTQPPESTESAHSAPPAPSFGTSGTIFAGHLPTVNAEADTIDFFGGSIQLETIHGTSYVPVQGAFDEASFGAMLSSINLEFSTRSERTSRLRVPLLATISAVKSHVNMIRVRTYPAVGYFAGLVPLSQFELLNDITGLPGNLLMAPVVTASNPANTIKSLSLNSALTIDTAAFSGLRQMKIPEFLDIIKGEIGATPTGSNVNVGVVDTGVTFNHPSFEDDNGDSRITYMRDFTSEGRVYVNPEARFEIKIPEASEIPDGIDASQTLILTAEVLKTVNGAGARPLSTDLVLIENAILLVSTELAEALKTPGSGAKLGIFDEASFATATKDGIDLNANGSKTDKFPMIFLPDGDGYKIYFAKSGLFDFRTVIARRDFNKTGDVITLGSEKFGFDIRKDDKLSSGNGEVRILSASIVGYDPGNHGSHVSGIIAGRRTISNDRADTLARGAAPAAKLMVNRVCGNAGCSAIEGYIDLAQNGAEIINMSIGGLNASNDEYGVGPLMIDRLTQLHNTLFLISAGNSGPGLNTVGSPSTAHLALSVGATATNAIIERQYQWPGTGKLGELTGPVDPDSDFMMIFSSRGPSASGGFKPNIVAPGTELSAIRLNATGEQRGLDVYWGTSMSSPAAAGAIALLLDAAKLYNAHNKSQEKTQLPTDALTLRKVILESAQPFDATTLNVKTGEMTFGKYTWIDQGAGMLNLPRAWEALKAERDSRLDSSVSYEKNGERIPVNLEYRVHTRATNPNGLDYTGTVAIDLRNPEAGTKRATGIWINPTGQSSLYTVGVSRSLPQGMLDRADIGELNRQLLTTMDEFHLETTIYGSHTNWVKSGTLQQVNCAASETSDIQVIGLGAMGQGEASGMFINRVKVCVDRELISTLPPGDHGALIRAYKKNSDGLEKNASFIIPVFLSVPNETLDQNAKLVSEGVVQSFGIARHYVRVPEATTLLKVTMEVPKAVISGPSIRGCSGILVYIMEASNTAIPEEAPSGRFRAQSCSFAGAATPDMAKVVFTRVNPKAGLWDLHVTGSYLVQESQYKITVEYAKISTSMTKIEGNASILNGDLDLTILQSSGDYAPSTDVSTYQFNQLWSSTKASVALKESTQVEDRNGSIYRSYGPDIPVVELDTSNSEGNDIDLVVFACKTAAPDDCKVAETSGSPTDIEKVTITPVLGMFYRVDVIGYSIKAGSETAIFDLSETRILKTPEVGSLEIVESEADSNLFSIQYSFDNNTSALFQTEDFLSGLSKIQGEIIVRTATGGVMANIPVRIYHSAAEEAARTNR